MAQADFLTGVNSTSSYPKAMRRLTPHLPSAVLVYWGLLFAALLVFARLAREVYEQEGFAFDGPLLVWLHGLQNPSLTALALGITWSGSVAVVIAVGAGLAFWLWFRSRWEVLFLVLGVGGAAGLNLAAKGFFERVRPDLFPHLMLESDFSFPSGHTMGSLAFALTMLLIVGRVVPGWSWAAWLGVAWAVLVALTRPYLQVHYPSDILAGWAMTTVWVMGLELLWRRFHLGFTSL